VQLASLQATAPATDDDPETDGGQIERVHDHDLDPAMYDPNTGEYFLAPKAPARKQKHAADRWVSTALAQVPITKH
jgi:hypothetical protein